MNDDTAAAKVLTVSDGVVHGTREDRSGAALVEQLHAAGYEVVEHRVVADGVETVAGALVEMAEGFAGLVVSTGGTGFAPRDLTPGGHPRRHRARGAGTGRGDAAREPARAAVARDRRHPGPGHHPQHAGIADWLRRAARRRARCVAPCARASDRRNDHALNCPASVHSIVVLRLVLPKGSLERATFELFEAADLAVSRSSAVDYKATIDDPRIDEVRILRPQEIPRYVAEGLFDLGITGRDWVEETGANVVSLGELGYSKATSNPIRVVVAVAADAEVEAGSTTCPTACGCRPSTPS